MAGVLFKQYVETHWNKNSEKFKEPEINENIRHQIKALLPTGLSDESSKIRLIVAFSGKFYFSKFQLLLEIKDLK